MPSLHEKKEMWIIGFIIAGLFPFFIVISLLQTSITNYYMFGQIADHILDITPKFIILT